MTAQTTARTMACIAALAFAPLSPAQTGVLAGVGNAATPRATRTFLGDPIVFVHGCAVPNLAGSGIGSGTNYVTSTYWWKMYEAFRREGYPAAPWEDTNGNGRLDKGDRIPLSARDDATSTGTSSLPGPDQYLNVLVQSTEHGQCGSLEQHAAELDAYVEQVLHATGAQKVDIVANSMGALTTRWYVKHSANARRHVRDIALLAGTNHGTNVALLTQPEQNPLLSSPNYDGARQASPAYECDPDGKRFQQRLNGCGFDDLVERIAGDDPADADKISWLNLYNNVIDELHQPTETSCLNQRFPNDCLGDTAVNVPLQNWPLQNPDVDGVTGDGTSCDGTAGACVPAEPHGDYRLNSEVIAATYEHVTRRKAKPSLHGSRP